ncbi:acetyl-CoA synthetase-like protein, partial [Ramicandelaber brevisporus]
MSSVEVPGSTAAPGETKPRMHVVWTRPGVTSFALDGCNNLHDLFLRGLRLADGGSGPFLGHRRILRTNSSEYSWLSYSEGLQRASNFGSGLAKLGVAQGTHLAFFAQNCAEYFIAREACNMYGFVAVPLYDTLGREAIETIVEDADIEVVLATCVKARILLDMVESIPKVKRIVLMDGAEDDVIEAADATGVRLDEQTTIEALGATQPEPPARVPTKDDAFAIIHTSGVSGKPKGVVLTHGNMLAAVGQIHLLVQQRMLYQFSKQDVYLSFLPLAHVMEQYLTTVLVSFGASIAVSQGNTLKLMDDLVTLRPTCFCAVPRIFNRIYGKVWDSVRAKGHASALLFKAAYSAKIANLRNGKITHWLWDRVIFKTLKDRLGGRVSFILSGSAPLGTDVLDFLRIGF